MINLEALAERITIELVREFDRSLNRYTEGVVRTLIKKAIKRGAKVAYLTGFNECMHPNGECTCFNEGQCDWCKKILKEEEIAYIKKAIES